MGGATKVGESCLFAVPKQPWIESQERHTRGARRLGMPSLPLDVSSSAKKKGGGADSSRGSARGTPKGGKKKKEPTATDVPATVPEGDEGGPSILTIATSTLFDVVSAKACQLRADFDLASDKAGEVPAGSVVHIIEQRPTPDGAMRMAVVPEGQTAVIGWLTGVTKDGKKNLSEIGRTVCEVTAAKALAARDAFELTSGKAGELAVGVYFHVMEARETADGAHRVAYALEVRTVTAAAGPEASRDSSRGTRARSAAVARVLPPACCSLRLLAAHGAAYCWLLAPGCCSPFPAAGRAVRACRCLAGNGRCQGLGDRHHKGRHD